MCILYVYYMYSCNICKLWCDAFWQFPDRVIALWYTTTTNNNNNNDNNKNNNDTATTTNNNDDNDFNNDNNTAIYVHSFVCMNVFFNIRWLSFNMRWIVSIYVWMYELNTNTYTNTRNSKK